MKKLFIILIVAAIGGAIFYACKKDNNELLTNESKAKITKNGLLVNPFEKYGIAHNTALDAVIRNPKFPEMTGEDIWDAIEPIFIEIFSEDYIHAPYSQVSGIIHEVDAVLDANDLRAFVVKMKDIGFLNENFSSEAITRNNYTILYDYWKQMEDLRSTDMIDIDSHYELIVGIEQEIITNYYSLLESGLMKVSNNDALYREYVGVLINVSIGVNSTEYWCYALPNRNDAISEHFKKMETHQRMIERAHADFLSASSNLVHQATSGNSEIDWEQNDAASALGSGGKALEAFCLRLE